MSIRDAEYADGGYDPSAPYENRSCWWDDDARLAWTVVDGVATSRPYNESETSVADSSVAASRDLDQQTGRQTALAGAIAQIQSVIAAASADTLHAQALALQVQADAALAAAPDTAWRAWVDTTMADLIAYRLWADQTVQSLGGVVQTLSLILSHRNLNDS